MILNSDNTLISSLKAKEKDAIGILYDKYASALYGIIFKIVKYDDVAEDVLQEVFIKIWKNAESFDPFKGKLFTWMLNIAKNSAIDMIRSKDYQNLQKNQIVVNNVNLIDTHFNVSMNPDLIDLKELVNTLKPEQKEVIDLIWLQGYTHQEVSNNFDIPLGTVKTRLRSGIIHLRKIFEKNGF